MKKAERQRIDAFKLWCGRRFLRVPWTARRSNQSILKEINPGISLEGMMLKLKLQYLAASCKELTHWKRLWCWEGLGAGGKGDDRGWDHWLDGYKFEWTPGVGELRQAWRAVIHGVAKSQIWLSYWTELNWTEYSIVCMYHSFLIHSSADGHLGCFHVLAIINSA